MHTSLDLAGLLAVPDLAPLADSINTGGGGSEPPVCGTRIGHHGVYSGQDANSLGGLTPLDGAGAPPTAKLTHLAIQCIVLLGMNVGKDLVAASSTPLVLAILAEGDSYGYAILKRVTELSGGRLQWTDGMLYPVLHRLERLGHVASRWERSDSGRRRKYYRITPQGRAHLEAQRRQWQAVDDTLRGVWSEMSLVRV